MSLTFPSLVNELALTGRKMYADEAKSCGLVRSVYNTSMLATRDVASPAIG